MPSALLLFAFSFALYAATIGGSYIDFDDRGVFLAHPELYGGNSLASNLSRIFLHAFPREEPLLIRDLTWAVEGRLFGMETAWPHHLGNVVLNAFNAVLAFVYLSRLTRRPGFAFACAAAWSMLAVRLEPVAWIMGRKDVLSAFFALIALTLALVGIEAKSAGRRALCDAGSLLAMAAAQLSKISALPLFAVMMLQYALRPAPAPAPPVASRFARAVLRYAPHALVSILIYGWYSGVLHEYGVTRRGPGFSPGYIGILLDFIPLVMAEYAKLLVFPFGLSIYHSWPSISIPLSFAEIAASRAILAGVVATTAVLAWRRRDLLFPWLCFWALMLTYLNLVYIGIWVADRYLYLSSLWLVALLAMPVARLVSGPSGALRATAVGVSSAVLLLNVAVVVVHQRDWTRNEKLWVYETSLARPSLLAYHQLVAEYLRQAQVESDPGRRDRLLESAWLAVQRGLRLFEELSPQPTPYLTPELGNHSRLLYFRGIILVERGAPLQQQLAAFQESLAEYPNGSGANMGAASVLYNMAIQAADGEQERLARQSLNYFKRYVRLAAGKPDETRSARLTLEKNWVGRFPFLQPEIDDIRARYLKEAR